MSLSASGTPASGPTSSPAAILASTRAADRQSTLAIHIKESVYLTIDLGDSIKMRLSYLDSTQLA